MLTLKEKFPEGQRCGLGVPASGGAEEAKRRSSLRLQLRPPCMRHVSNGSSASDSRCARRVRFSSDSGHIAASTLIDGTFLKFFPRNWERVFKGSKIQKGGWGGMPGASSYRHTALCPTPAACRPQPNRDAATSRLVAAHASCGSTSCSGFTSGYFPGGAGFGLCPVVLCTCGLLAVS
jgi:hypothetical protein